MSIKRENKQMSLFIPEPSKYVRSDHPYRFYLSSIDFAKLCYPLEELYSNLGRSGYRVTSAFKCLLLQYMHDLSDRELEEHVRDSMAARYFCGFSLEEETPTYSFFTRFRSRIGTKGLSEIFNKFRDACKEAGHIGEVFTFVDSTDLSSRCDTWAARDKAIADIENKETDDDGKPTMNNRNCDKYSSDSQARYGGKGKNKIWFGYKRHMAVDCKLGFITKVAITPANVSDSKGAKHVLPNQGAVLADKAYSVGFSSREIKARGLHSMAIKNNNAKNKNRQKDCFISKIRMPFEGVFSCMTKFTRFRGVAKTQFQAFMEAFVYNCKKLCKINSVPILIH
jgi:transposase, IS5 family